MLLRLWNPRKIDLYLQCDFQPLTCLRFVTEQYYKHNKEFFGEQGPYAQLYAINSMVSDISSTLRYTLIDHNQVFSLGLTIGPLVAGGLRDRIGFGNMTAVIASLCAVVSVLSFFFLGGKPKKLRS